MDRHLTPPLRAGDPSDNGSGPAISFEELYRDAFARLVRRFGARGHERNVAEDLAQETLLRACASLHRLDPSRPAWPWLVAIARCVAADHSRRRRPEVPSTADVAKDQPELAAVEDRSVLAAALRALTPRHRAALGLRYVEDLEPRHAAEALGMSVTALNQLLFRARERLREEYRRLTEGVPALGALVRARLRALGHRVSRQAGRWRSLVEAAAEKAAGVAVAVLLVIGPPAPGGPAPGGPAPGGPTSTIAEDRPASVPSAAPVVEHTAPPPNVGDVPPGAPSRGPAQDAAGSAGHISLDRQLASSASSAAGPAVGADPSSPRGGPAQVGLGPPLEAAVATVDKVLADAPAPVKIELSDP